jgi:glucokinase
VTYLGFDIRDSSALAVAVDANGRVLAQAAHSAADALAATVAARADVERGMPAAAIGVAVHERDEEATRLAAWLAPDAAVVTTGAAVALAEQWCGAAKDAQQVVALVAGDSVQAGILIDGRPFDGAHGLAGSAGWLTLNPVEREDYRRFGCLEAEVGAAGIVRRLVWRIKSGDYSRVADMVDGNLAAIGVEQVFAAARDRDGVAVSVVRDTARYIGMAVANLVATLDPDVVVLGGLVAVADDLLLDAARQELARRVPVRVSRQVRVVPAALGARSAAIGAARAAALTSLPGALR